MKNRLILPLILLALLVSSCKSTEKKETPEEVSKAFITAFHTADFNNIYKYTLRNNKIIIQQLEKTTDEAQRERMKKVSLEFKQVTCKMHNDSLAECECQYKKDGAPRKVVLDLCKEDDRWVVDLVAHPKNQ